LRYGKHILTRAIRNPGAELERIFGDYSEPAQNSAEPPQIEGVRAGSLANLAESNEVQP
jgi:hypothetical protein